MTRSGLLVLLTHFLILVSSHQQAEARLGENVDQCVERYGAVVKKTPARLPDSDPEACVFSKSGISIIVEFRDNKAWNLTFRTIDLTNAQAVEILKLNLPEGAGWSSSYEVSGILYRRCSDHSSVAAYDPGKRGGTGILEIASHDFSIAWRSQYAAKVTDMMASPRARAGTKGLEGF